MLIWKKTWRNCLYVSVLLLITRQNQVINFFTYCLPSQSVTAYIEYINLSVHNITIYFIYIKNSTLSGQYTIFNVYEISCVMDWHIYVFYKNQIINPRHQVFQDMMLCHRVSGSQHCKGNTFLQNMGRNHPLCDRVAHPRRQESAATLLQETKTSLLVIHWKLNGRNHIFKGTQCSIESLNTCYHPV